MQKTRQPLVASADPGVVAEARRLAAAAGVEISIAADAESTLRGWLAAPAVLVGADLAAAIGRQRPARRPDVHLIGHGPLATDSFRDAVAVGAASVAELPESQSWLLELFADLADGAGEAGLRIGVMGGAGGVGSTVFAAALGLRAAGRGPSVLVDLDVLGGGIDRVLGLERRPGARWDGLAQATGRLSARSLSEALPSDRGLSFLAFGATRPQALSAFAVREVMSACQRAFRCTVVDLPRWSDDVIGEVVAGCDLVAVVCARTALAVESARRVVERLPPQVAAGLVVRRDGIGLTSTEISRALKAPILHEMGPQRGLDEALGLGAGPVRGRRSALARAADDVLAVALGDVADADRRRIAG